VRRDYSVHRRLTCCPVALALLQLCRASCLLVSRPHWLHFANTRVRVPWHVARFVARLVVNFFTYAARPGASARHAARRRLLRLAQTHRRLLRLRRASGCLSTSRGSSRGLSSTSSPTSHLRVPRLLVRLVVDYFDYAARPSASARRTARHAARRRLLRLRRASVCLGTSHNSSSITLPTPCVRVPRHVARLVAPLVVDFFAYAAPPGPSAPHAARRRLLRLRRVSGYLDTSHGSSRRSSSTTSSRGSLSISSPTPRIWVPRHVARLVVDYFASRRLVVDYFAYAARRVPRHVARLVARLVVDYFIYAARPGASARRAAPHAAPRRLLRLRRVSPGASACRAALRAARRRLLRLRCASGCLGTSRGSSHRLSSTTSPTPRVRVPRHVARLVTRLVIDYSVRRDFVLRPHWLYFSHMVHRDYLPHSNTGSASSTSRTAVTSSSSRIASTIHLD
jgi:hypothetical protein